MANFLKRLGCLVLGLTLGALSGYLSTYGLDQLSAFWRPPLVFWGFTVVVCLIATTKVKWSYAYLLILFIVAYLSSLTIGQVFTGMMVFGEILMMLIFYFVLHIKHLRFFIIAVVILLFVGIIFDLNFEYLTKLFDGEDALQHFRDDNSIGGLGTAVIFTWQTITLGAITLQLNTEKRYRQSREALQDDYGEAEEIPTEHNEDKEPNADSGSE